MILNSLIQVISVLLAFTLLGTLIATSTYYARYKINNKSNKPMTAQSASATTDWNIQLPMVTEPIVVNKKRLQFRHQQASFKEHVS